MVPLPAPSGSTAFCWVCWDKNYTGPTVLGWVPGPPKPSRRISTPQQRNQATAAPVLLPPAASERKGTPEQREQRGVAIAKRVLKLATSRGFVDARDSGGAHWTGIAFLMLRNTDIFDQLPAPTGKAAAEPLVFTPAKTDRTTTPLADAALQPVATWQLIAPSFGKRPSLIVGALPDGQQVTLQVPVHEALVWAARPGGALLAEMVRGFVFAHDVTGLIVGVGAVTRKRRD
jgi:hypothetical protein